MRVKAQASTVLSCGVREHRDHPVTPPVFFSILLALVGFKG
jgi:hypothetical protein